MLSTTYYPLSAPCGEVTAIEISPHCDAVTAFQRLLGGRPRHLFFLDSALRQHGLSRYSLLGCKPFLVLKSKGTNITVEDGTGAPQEREGNPFEVLRSYLRTFSVGATRWAAPGESEVALPPICRAGVAVGYLGYDLHHFLERLPKNAIDDLEFPDMYFGFYDNLSSMTTKRADVFWLGEIWRTAYGNLMPSCAPRAQGRPAGSPLLRERDVR